MRYFYILLLMGFFVPPVFSYDYLLTDNNLGGFYESILKMPDTDGIVYGYETLLGGLDSSDVQYEGEATPDGIERNLRLIDGSGGTGGLDGDSLWGPWGTNKRLDLLFDLGDIYKLTKIDLRSQGNGVTTGVQRFTVRISKDRVPLKLDSQDIENIGWQEVCSLDDYDEGINHSLGDNYVDFSETPKYGRYVWFEIHGLGSQLQVAELALFGDLTEIPTTCQEVIEFGLTDQHDLNKDCSIYIGDLAIMASNWLKCNNPMSDDCEDVYVVP